MTITRESYSLFLQAGGRPEVGWWEEQTPEVQAELALVGLTYYANMFLSLGEAIRDPDKFEVEQFGTEEEAEEMRLQRLAVQAIGDLSDDAQSPVVRRGLSMAGALAAQEEDDKAAREDELKEVAKRRLLGIQPDVIRKGAKQ